MCVTYVWYYNNSKDTDLPQTACNFLPTGKYCSNNALALKSTC